MIIADYTTLQTPLRTIKGKVELNGSTTFSHTDALKNFTIDRLGESGRFFGFGIPQKLTINLLDKDRVINIEDGAEFTPYLTADEEYPTNVFTTFVVNGAETKRNENTNDLTIVAYDSLGAASSHLLSELNIIPPYTLQDVAEAIIDFLSGGKYPVGHSQELNDAFSLEFAEGANFEGTETLREVLDDIAEITQTIYYMSGNDGSLMFKRLGDEIALHIPKSQYFELDSSDPITLAAICSATELGDNITATSTTITGETEYIRNNSFLDLHENRTELIEAALAAVEGLTIQPFNCNWRGNYYLEIGDKITVETKDGGLVSSYMLNDVIEYSGALKQKTLWESKKVKETDSNPSTLGEVLKQTFAKVDKANKQIDIVASEADANNSAISSLQINTESISSSVSQMITNTEEKLEEVDNFINEFNTTMEQTAENIKIAVKQEIDEEGVAKVTTETGFTFDETGLTVAKDGSNITTTITEDGMTVQLDDTPVLTANNAGVDAMNLHATTYLFIGQNSRFQDYNNGTRTGCFWIGK